MEENNYSAFSVQKFNSETSLSPSMEDYLEMIFRILCTDKVVRINKLAEKLNVKASSASKMVTALTEMGLLNYQKYGFITITDDGYALGEYLLHRHQVLNEFLCLVNNSDDETGQVERIEHFLNKQTVSNIEILNTLIKKNNFLNK